MDMWESENKPTETTVSDAMALEEHLSCRGPTPGGYDRNSVQSENMSWASPNGTCPFVVQSNP